MGGWVVWGGRAVVVVVVRVGGWVGMGVWGVVVVVVVVPFVACLLALAL